MLKELERTLHEDIPITTQLGITVLEYEADSLALKAPLDANINHKGTAFAGSIYAVATLAGWGLIWLLLREAEIAARIVIQESSIRYRLPITQDMVAICSKPSPARLEQFFVMLRRKGIARLELQTQIREGGHTAVEFTGRYVASLHREHVDL